MTEENTPNPKTETPTSDSPAVEETKEAEVEETKEAVVEKTKEAVVEETKEAEVEKTKEAVVEETKEAVVEKTKEAVVEETKEAEVEKTKEAVVEETPKKVETVEARAPKKKVEAKPVPKPTGDAPDGHWWWGTGRRKTAVARVRIRPGNGEFQVNKRQLTDFFSEIRDHQNILAVLDKTNTKGSVDVFVNTNGGGFTGQAGAIILGLGRALAKYDPSLESILRDNGYLSRDPRKVERKKPGQPKARKRFQFSKR
jgi:small subunit ribosomal protein S9